jgi:hypothetical protein
LLTTPSLLPPLYTSLAAPSATPQLSVSAIANSASSHLGNISSATSLLQQYAQGGSGSSKKAVPEKGTAGNAQQTDIEPNGPDPKDVDKVLGELVALGGRWALFRRFVNGRLEVGSLSLHLNAGRALPGLVIDLVRRTTKKRSQVRYLTLAVLHRVRRRARLMRN